MFIIHHGAQFFMAERVEGVVFDINSEQPQQGIGKQIHGPDNGISDGKQRRVHHSSRQCQFFSMQCRNSFRSQFSEDKNGKNQDKGGHRNSNVTVQAIADVGGQLCNQDVDHIIA